MVINMRWRKGYRYVIQMDADGQHDVCNLLEIYKELQKEDENGKLPDIVLGSRFMEGSSGFSVSFAKKIAFVWFRIMLKTGTGRRITDPTTGLQGLNWRTFLFYSKYNNFDDKYPDANMLMQMLLLGFRVREIPCSDACKDYRSQYAFRTETSTLYVQNDVFNPGCMDQGKDP